MATYYVNIEIEMDGDEEDIRKMIEEMGTLTFKPSFNVFDGFLGLDVIY